MPITISRASEPIYDAAGVYTRAREQKRSTDNEYDIAGRRIAEQAREFDQSQAAREEFYRRQEAIRRQEQEQQRVSNLENSVNQQQAALQKGVQNARSQNIGFNSGQQTQYDLLNGHLEKIDMQLVDGTIEPSEALRAKQQILRKLGTLRPQTPILTPQQLDAQNTYINEQTGEEIHINPRTGARTVTGLKPGPVERKALQDAKAAKERGELELKAMGVFQDLVKVFGGDQPTAEHIAAARKAIMSNPTFGGFDPLPGGIPEGGVFGKKPIKKEWTFQDETKAQEQARKNLGWNENAQPKDNPSQQAVQAEALRIRQEFENPGAANQRGNAAGDASATGVGEAPLSFDAFRQKYQGRVPADKLQQVHTNYLNNHQDMLRQTKDAPAPQGLQLQPGELWKDAKGNLFRNREAAAPAAIEGEQGAVPAQQPRIVAQEGESPISAKEQQMLSNPDFAKHVLTQPEYRQEDFAKNGKADAFPAYQQARQRILSRLPKVNSAAELHAAQAAGHQFVQDANGRKFQIPDAKKPVAVQPAPPAKFGGERIPVFNDTDPALWDKWGNPPPVGQQQPRQPMSLEGELNRNPNAVRPALKGVPVPLQEVPAGAVQVVQPNAIPPVPLREAQPPQVSPDVNTRLQELFLSNPEMRPHLESQQPLTKEALRPILGLNPDDDVDSAFENYLKSRDRFQGGGVDDDAGAFNQFNGGGYDVGFNYTSPYETQAGEGLFGDYGYFA